MPTLAEFFTPMGANVASLSKMETIMILIIHFVIAGIALAMISWGIGLLSMTRHKPTPPKGWAAYDYDAGRINRKSLQQYATDNSIPDTTPMIQFSVATANFGGIFTENANPWIGSVDPEAARLQVDAGARAIVFDIWPDPADPSTPTVASMMDMSAWKSLGWWRDHGLGAGLGTYSNWQKLTRNSAPLGDVLKAATTSAFSSPATSQNSDPFFIILNLHGAMTPAYLKRMALILQDAIGPNGMGPDWIRAKGQRNLCTEPYTTFLNKAFVIVCPDISPGYNSLPNTNTWDDFAAQFLASDMGEFTNALERGPNTLHFLPSGIAALNTASQPNCAIGGPNLKPPAAGFCVIQPTIGGQTTENDTLFKDNSYGTCLATGAQFVAVNLFSTNEKEDTLAAHFDPAQFGTYSFKKGV